jgi:branched-chain amino acid transport system ATP-binding protein
VGGNDDVSAALEIDGVSKRFAGLRAVHDLSFRVDTGEIVGLIGPNGAGKTTTVDLIAGFQRVDAGSIRFGGKALVGLRPHAVARLGLCKTFQVAQPFGDMTVLENAMVGALAWTSRVARAEGAAVQNVLRVGLGHRLHSRARELTTIDQRRLEVARALATRPRLLLLDETMAGLNPSEVEVGLKLIHDLRADGLTLLVIEHNVRAIVALADRLVAMDHGQKIAEGRPADVVRDEAVVTAYLGQPHDA